MEKGPKGEFTVFLEHERRLFEGVDALATPAGGPDTRGNCLAAHEGRLFEGVDALATPAGGPLERVNSLKNPEKVGEKTVNSLENWKKVS
jgi:hypothetical protein